MLLHPGSHTFNRTTTPLILPLAMFVATFLLLAFAILLCFVIGAEGAAPNRPNFSGVWIFNPEESKLEVPQPTSMIFRIDQTGTDAAFVRTRTIGSETDTWQLTIAIDGAEAIQERGRMKVRFRVYWRGEALVLESSSVGERYSATNIIEYSLSNSARRLTAMERFKGPQLEYANMWVFDRK